ncbi:MAG: lactate utilization protein [Chloroflexota bacterium]|nr:lactate utilization protein [Anaerolineae bacterium]HMM28000.1 lactate utilization protein [Aggregatilineaceae bacterium]
MTSRDTILGRLRAVTPPYAGEPPAPDDLLPVAPLDGGDRAALVERFAAQAEALSSRVYRCGGADEALATILQIVAPDTRVLCWAFEHIPLPGLAEALARAGVAVAPPGDASVRVGITGADAALAATGSLALLSGPGQPRQTSLLPLVHVAVVRADQVVPHLEAWIAGQRARGLEAFAAASSAVIISGPSRTADIAMELILGMHGPGELHIVLLDDQTPDR